jgi:cell wall-associated NlpC family hydrolase
MLKRITAAAVALIVLTAGGSLAAAQHIVKKGETLWQIAEKENMYFSRIKEINPQLKNPNVLYIGQKINVDDTPPQDKIVELALAMKPVTKYAYGADRWAAGIFYGDCSSWTHYIFSEALGVQLPRVSWEQATYGTKVKSFADMQKGDLMFFGDNGKVSHVGIYLGLYNGQKSWISNLGTGKDVQIFTLNGSWTKSRFLWAGHIIE